MCGIAGVLDVGGPRLAPSAAIASRMIARLSHRGPDALASWDDESAGVGLSHARLAIRDLSPTGEQPMSSADGRYVIVYNGEVYSQQELTSKLAAVGRQLRGTSDTEAMIESIAAFGLDATLPMLIGMFAFALWDCQEQKLTLVRDRMGIKPLYWTVSGGNFAFASELKAFTELPGWSPTVDRNSVATYLRHNYIPAPHTIFRDVSKLQPGSVLTVDQTGKVDIRKFWDLSAAALSGITERSKRLNAPSISDVEVLLTDAVSRRLVSDVPVGSLLSGGIDSSLVTALMAETSSSRVRTYSIGFPVNGYDEAPFARAVAQHLGTEHTELYVEPSHALDLVTSLPHIYDEPFADSSQLPSIMVSELTRQHVTVALTGDGGDELFAGYNRYTLGLDIASKLRALPAPVRTAFAAAARHAPEELLNRLAGMAPKKFSRPQAGTKVKELATMAAGNDPNAFYRGLVTHWPNPGSLVRGGTEYRGPLWNLGLAAAVPDELDRMQLLDMLTYLSDDILVKMDRASMSVALEARVPLLDHRLVEMSWRLPQDMKIRNGQSKWVLREILYKRVPRELIERPKMGFGIPIDVWLRGPLKAWAEDLLAPDRLRSQGLLDPEPILAKWSAHQRGENWAYPLWDVLMLQAWIEEWQPALG